LFVVKKPESEFYGMELIRVNPLTADEGLIPNPLRRLQSSD